MREYAIVDIETTGGNASHSRITEIAIIIHDGATILERWETLINPQKDISLSIFALTGINNEMVENAPIFDDVADKIFSLLNNRVFVAHNVNFDYSFVNHQLEQSGFKWKASKLCTVRAARKIKPGLPSYSLGKLCKSLDIKLLNQHRAGGDADATAILFSKLLAWDEGNEIEKMVKNTAQDQRLPPNLPKEDFENLPQKPGVYYFYNQLREVIYVGKAINLKKRVTSHFTGNSITPQRQNFLREIFGVSFEICATEFMALLLECSEIKKLWPIHNRALKKFEPKFGLHEYEARNGYRYLAIGKLSKGQQAVETFGNIHEGINLLIQLIDQFKIDIRFCNFGQKEVGIFQQVVSKEALPSLTNHNTKVENALDFLSQNRPTYAIVDKGRSVDERSCIWVEKGHFYGMGYIANEEVIYEPQQLKEHVTRYQSNQYIMKLIHSYVEKHPSKVQRIAV